VRAVKAATEIVQHNAEFPGSIGAMVEPLVPAALAVREEKGDPVEKGVGENVRRIAARLRSPEQPLLYPPQPIGKLKVVGAVYDLETGIVDFFDVPDPAPQPTPTQH
jgi:carbonic anhydrase